MDGTTHRRSFLQRTAWATGSAGLLLLMTAGGLELSTQWKPDHFGFGTLLLMLHLASWAYVLGLAGLLVSAASWLVSRPHTRSPQRAMSRCSSSGRRRDVEQPELKRCSAWVA
ncbi:hypothetical protein [Candidatus Nitrospira bockiana]